MAVTEIIEAEVDSIVLGLLKLHSDVIDIDAQLFHDLLKHSLSLNTMEKKRVIDAVPTLSQFQFDELSKVFTEEREKFRELAKDHPDDIKKLLVKQQQEWLHLWDMYKSELENNNLQEAEKLQQEEIKKSLGL